MICPRCQGTGELRVPARTMKPWEEVAISVIDSLSSHELSPYLARAWLKTIVDYAERT